MDDFSKIKIPFTDIEAYLEGHEDLISSLIKLEKRGVI
jgi:hypothetical protein